MKNQKSNSVAKKVESKKEIDLSKLTAIELAEMNLDEINLYDLLEKNKQAKTEKLVSKKDTKEPQYKNKPEEKKLHRNFRTKMRRIRNKNIENVISNFEQKNVEGLKKAINSFNDFYKKEYCLNDYSLSSLSRLNADKNTLARINIFLSIIKKSK